MSSPFKLLKSHTPLALVLFIFLAGFIRSGISTFSLCNSPMDRIKELDSQHSAIIMMVILKSPSVSEVRASLGHKTTPSETDALVDSIKSEQDSMKILIEGVGGEVLGQYQFAMNGIKVRIPTDQVDCLKTLPNVREVLPVGKYHLQEDN